MQIRVGEMTYLRAALLLCIGLLGGTPALARDSCTHEWPKDAYKTHRQLEEELPPALGEGKILKFSLCTSGAEHYFQVTILEQTGKVRVIRLPAR
jgi:hypothetical protein